MSECPSVILFISPAALSLESAAGSAVSRSEWVAFDEGLLHEQCGGWSSAFRGMLATRICSDSSR